MSRVADRQSVTKSRGQPLLANVCTKLWPGAKSARVAPCRANGAQTSVGAPRAAVEKSRSSMVGRSRRTRLAVVQAGFTACVGVILAVAINWAKPLA